LRATASSSAERHHRPGLQKRSSDRARAALKSLPFALIAGFASLRQYSLVEQRLGRAGERVI
jgi:hypothetical protein